MEHVRSALRRLLHFDIMPALHTAIDNGLQIKFSSMIVLRLNLAATRQGALVS